MCNLVLYQKHKSITFKFLSRYKNGNTNVLSLVSLSTYYDTKYKVQQGLQISVTEALKQASQETVNKEDHLKSMLLGLSKTTDGGMLDPQKQCNFEDTMRVQQHFRSTRATATNISILESLVLLVGGSKGRKFEQNTLTQILARINR